MFGLTRSKFILLLSIVLVFIFSITAVLIIVYAHLKIPKTSSLIHPNKPAEKTELEQIQELVQRAIENGEKEPLVTISKDGFSPSEIKIKPNQFISFYNSTNQEVTLESEILPKATKFEAGIFLSIKIVKSTEIKLENKVLKITAEE